jgi:hypothetical protein
MCSVCDSLEETLEICDQNELSPDEVMQLAVELMKVAILHQMGMDPADGLH